MVEQGCSGSWTESVGPRSECRTQREPQELFDLFFGNQMFYDIHRDLKNLSSFFFYIKISQLLDWLPGWLATKEMEFIKRQGTNVCQCIATWTTSATKDHFHFSLHQISNFHSHTAIAALRLKMLSKIWGEACCLIPSHLRWTYSRKIYLWSSNIMVLT